MDVASSCCLSGNIFFILRFTIRHFLNISLKYTNMKKILLLITVCLVTISLSAQIGRQSPAKIYRPSPLPPTTTGVTDYSTMLYKIESISYRYEFLYDEFGNLAQELYTYINDESSNFKCTYTYDDNQNMLRRNIYSWSNGDWFYSSYEEFTYNDLNQRITRTNANNFGEGFTIGGIGYYEYNEDGNLASYLQQINMGNYYDDLDSMVYLYDEDQKWVGFESYSVEGNVWSLYYRSEMTYNQNNKYDSLIDLFLTDGVWELNTKYHWTYNSENNPEERNYHITDGNGGWSSPQDKYVFRYRSDLESENVLFPYAASIYNEWENRFGASVPVDEEDWWTINLNDNQLTYIETSTYYYAPFHAGISDNRKASYTVSPNPAQDQLQLDFGNESNVNVMFYDISGKLLNQYMVNHSETISLANYPQGIYLMKAYSNNQLIGTEKIIKY